MASQPEDKKSRALSALTMAALGLPAFQGQAAARDENTRLGLRFSQYAEHQIDADKTSNVVRDRYDISVLQASIGTPLLKRLRLNVNGQYEVLSGASPWYVEPEDPSAGAASRPIQVMSGATIDEARVDVSAELRHYGDAVEVAGQVGISKENDYESISAGVEARYDLPNKHTALNAGLGYSDDRINPTEGGSARFLTRPTEREKSSVNAVIGVSQIINAKTVFRSALSYSMHDGFLSDPYKLAWVAGSLRQDSRPAERGLWSWSNQLRIRVASMDASLHLDYRYFNDDWDVESHTAEIAWFQGLGDGWSIAPSLRYYSQSQAFFYRPFFTSTRADELYSSDYRLSPYGAINLGLSATKRYGPHALVFSIDSYNSSGSYAINQVEVENPGLVDYTRLSIGMDFGL